MSGISAIRRSIGWFHKHWKWRVGKLKKIPFSIGWTWYSRQNACVLRHFASFVDLIFGVLLSKVFLILKQWTVRCQTKYFMDKMNYVSRCELVYSKKFDIQNVLPNNYCVSVTMSRFRGLHFESHAINLCCKICKKVRCNSGI